MAGYGDARTRSDATLRLPGSGQTFRPAHAARSPATRSACTPPPTPTTPPAWRLRRRLAAIRPLRQPHQQRPGRLRYDADVWSASLETGYALRPFVAGSALADLVVEPKAQLLYSHYKAQDATLQGTRMQAASATPSPPAPACASIPAAPDAPQPKIRPFLEANWSTRPAPRPCAWAPTRWTRPPQRARTQARRARADRTQCAGLGPGHRPARQRRPAWLRRHAERQLSLVVSVGGATRRAPTWVNPGILAPK